MSRQMQERLWNEFAMVWLEKFALGLLALIFWNWVLNNGSQMDGHYRVALGLIVLGLSYGIGHAVYRESQKNKAAIQVATPAPSLSPLPGAPSVEQTSADSTCSNIVAGQDAKVNCSPDATNKDASKRNANP